MLKIETEKNLKDYTTIKIGAAAEFFTVVKDRADLLEAINWARENKKAIWILGGGSNILISKRIKGLVIKNEIRGMEIVDTDSESALVEAKSGEGWTKFVNFTLSHDLYGLENLFLIYGTVGAAPIQNIGAYGVELKDCFHHLKAIDLENGYEKIFSLPDCQFGYRDSVFKHGLKGKYFIYSVTLRLKRQPDFKLDYGSIREKLLERGVEKPKAKDVIRVIQDIRNEKIPNPGVLPNAGSFFQNVEVTQARLKTLLKEYPEMPNFPAGGGRVKIPAGWLIEQAGFKGKKIGPVSMYEKQALILVNDGGAESRHVLNLAKKVQTAVKEQFGLDLVEEVNII